MSTIMMVNYIKILKMTNVSDICISFVRGCFVVYKHSVVQLKVLFSHLLIYILCSYKFPYKIIMELCLKILINQTDAPQKRNWDNYCICFINITKL